MMKHVNKYLSLALALVLCLSLAACGESNEDYGDDGSDYNLYGVPDSFEGLVKDSEQMANLYIYGGAWTGEDGGTLIVANNDEGAEAETTATLHDLGNTVQTNDLFNVAGILLRLLLLFHIYPALAVLSDH